MIIDGLLGYIVVKYVFHILSMSFMYPSRRIKKNIRTTVLIYALYNTFNF